MCILMRLTREEKKWCACATSQSMAKINLGEGCLIIPREIFTWVAYVGRFGWFRADVMEEVADVTTKRSQSSVDGFN